MERSRQSGGFIQQPNVAMWSLGNGCGQTSWTQTATNGTIKTGEYKSMSDTVVPNFYRNMRRGIIHMNRMYQYRKKVTSNGGSGFHIRSKSTSCASPLMYHEYKAIGDYFAFRIAANGSPDPQSLFTSSEELGAMVEVSTCVANKRGRADSNLWETLAELHKAAQLFSNIANRANRFLDSRGAPEAAANEWLAYRYGLRPLISDGEAVIQGLKKKIGNVRKTSRCQVTLTRSQNSNLYYDHDYVRDNYLLSSKHDLTVRGMSIDEFSADLLTNVGFTTKGLLTLPWELIPYSFVSDWFVNVGDFIGAIAPAFGYRQLGSCLVVHNKLSSQWIMASTTEVAGSYSVVMPTTGTITSELETKRRQGLLDPGIVVKSDFRFDTFTRLADSFALIGQRAAGRLR